ncbi:flavin reductase family protein [Tropicimonas marinistellae]|uniref:flavin reductase family protein n=1 Tax=Tropicimonas marinistellae TaxID=1739787 RepID=UPI000834A19A|nr:flavin reductase family protein [Tropicimonas marinistellae]
MFYRPEDGHGLPHNPFSAIVAPRPIAWISTRGTDGSENLAPYSFFNAVAYTPPQVMFATTGKKHDREGTKDTLANIRDTGVFAVNIVEFAKREVMNLTSGPWDKDVDEAEMAGIARGECDTINCGRIADAPATLECKLTQIVDLQGPNNRVAFGEVTGIHLRDDCIVDGRFDVTRFQPLARLGYRDFTHVSEVFVMQRPGET